ncbi:MAG: SDR family oxidoreductase [Alphaproteobacteria bacterium]|nr:SDR family oxidoreductase [Alphaproteobacteria bacterium]
MSHPEFTFTDKVVLITGGSRGIGRATAELFAARGAKVVTTSSHSVPLSFSDEYATRIRHLHADVSDEEAARTVFKSCEEIFGPVSILVNNAAIISNTSFKDMAMQDWDDVIKTNIRGAVIYSKLAFDQMIRHKQGGSIINISSLAGIPNIQKFPGFSPYTVSKFAICGLTESLAVEGIEHGIRVNAIAPGAVDTEMLQKAAAGLKTSTTPLDIAKIILFLADENQSRIINGSIIPVFCNGD